jgi:hypothetical protein
LIGEGGAVSPTTISTYSGGGTITESAEQEPSASRPTFVALKMLAESGTRAIEVKVGGVFVTSLGAPTGQTSNASFIVPAGKKWVWKSTSGGPSPVEVKYLPM